MVACPLVRLTDLKDGLKWCRGDGIGAMVGVDCIAGEDSTRVGVIIVHKVLRVFGAVE